MLANPQSLPNMPDVPETSTSEKRLQGRPRLSPSGKVKPINVTFAPSVLATLDKRCREANQSRGKFLTELIETYETAQAIQ
jgi:hypothetical protein